MQYDIIAFQLEGKNTCLACTPAGHEFLSQFYPKDDWSFLDYITHIGCNDMVVGVLTPEGQTLEFEEKFFRSPPLH